MARHLVAAYCLLIIYASLYPLTSWTDTGAPLLDFLTAPWPRYFTAFDLVLNVLAYVPLGLLLVPALPQRWKQGYTVISAVMLGALLSFAVETLQHFLPTRVPSNVDLGCNTLGTLLGALIGVPFGRAFTTHGALTRWRERRILHGGLGDAGLALIAVWLVSHCNPEVRLFGNGDLRSLLGLSAPLAFTAGRYFAIEQMVAGAGVVSVGLLAWQLMRQPSVWLLGMLFLLAILVKVVATAILLEPGSAMDWMTPGAAMGAGIGAGILTIALFLPAQAQATVAATALLAATVLVNLGPENPYLTETLSRWYQGHFLNFVGLTRLASMVWPFLALALIIALSASSNAKK